MHPNVITGSADGRIRVWKGNTLAGDLVVGEGGGVKKSPAGDRRSRRGSIREDDVDTDYRVDSDSVPHYGSLVQALAIDVRSKYLFSGDSSGRILVWRMNNSGWYQMLRHFVKGKWQFCCFDVEVYLS